MIHVALLATSLMFGASVRTPKLPDVPLDYEISAGVENSSLEAWTFYERENGINYTGVDLSGKLKRKLVENRGFFQNRQSKNILRGGISTSIIVFKYGRVGLANVWDHMDPAATMQIGIESKPVKARLNVYEDGIEGADLTVSKDFKLSDNLSVSPFFKYSIDRKGTEFMQGKVVWKLRGRS